MIGIAQALAAQRRRHVELPALRPCPFCGGRPVLAVDPCWHHEGQVPCSALVCCPGCGTEGPSYLYPLVCRKGTPWPDWDPRLRAAEAWNGRVHVDGLQLCRWWSDP